MHASFLACRILCDTIPTFGEEQQKQVVWHIPHARSEEMGRKSECVSQLAVYVLILAEDILWNHSFLDTLIGTS